MSKLFGVVMAVLVTPFVLNAQTSVTLYVCNAGKADVDVFFSQSKQVTSKHVAPADCATVAHTEGAMAPASVGFAFTDARGQWGSPRRLDVLLESDKEAFDPDHQTTTPVKHGTANVTLPMQLYFHPAEPTCKTITTPGIAQYPSLSPTPAQKARAEADAAARSTSETFCEQLGYKLNVEAYPDTKELSFNQYCDSCDKKADASATPDERAATQQRSDIATSLMSAMERSSGIGGVIWSNVMGAAVHAWSPAENPIPVTTPTPSAAPPPAPAGAAPVSRGITRGDVVQNRTRTAAPAQTAAPPQTTPAPQPSAATTPPQTAAATPTAQPVPNRAAAPSPAQPAGQPTDQMVESVIRLLKAKTPEPIILEMVLSQRTPHQLSGADRARLEDAGASEKLIDTLLNPSSTSAPTNPAGAQSQKYAACQAQANRQFPNDKVARTKAFTVCMQK